MLLVKISFDFSKMSFWTKSRLKSEYLIWTEKRTWASPNYFKFEIPESGSNQMSTSFTAISRWSSNIPRISKIMWISQSSNFRLSIYCSSLAMLTSIIAVIQNTDIQIFNQIVFILYRGSVFGWYLTTLTATFPMKYFGRLYGLGVVRFSMNYEFQLLKLSLRLYRPQ